MKKISNILILVAAAAMGFTACQKEIQEEVPVNEGTVQVTFVAGAPETKTTVDTSGEKPVFAWDENETFAVLEQTDALAEASSVAYSKVDDKANIDAEFKANAGHASYDYVTIYPASGYVSAESLLSATLCLPAEQRMAGSSYDPAADLMVSEVVSTNAQPEGAQMVGFTRMAAVVKMTIKNFEVEAGDEVEQVIFTADGKSLAGTVTANLADPHKFTVAEGVDNVTVNTISSGDVYLTVLPTTLEAGDAYTVAVITNKKLYIKKGVIPAEKSLAFEAGMVTRFSVNMQGVVPSEKWVLVRDASTLKQGDVVTIAASDYNYVMGKMSSSYAYASYTEVIKMGDYLYHPITPEGTTSGDKVLQQLTLVESDKNNAFHFYNGVDFTGDSYSGYVCVPISNNNLKVQDYPDHKSLFYLEIDNKTGVASVVASDSEVTYNALKYRAYNGGSSTNNRRFGCANSTATDVYDVCIYKLAGVKGVVPTAGAVVTVPDADEKVVVPVEGVAEETVFEDVEFTYVGDWTIEAETDAEWLTVNYSDGALSYTAKANDGTVRYAVVTITASHEGETSKKWTFNVVQKGAPVKVSVEEFIGKAVDANVEYEVTGILKTKPSGGSSSTYVVDADGNQATFKYIDMEDGTDFYKSEIAEGDIVTIVAAVASKGTGGSSTAHAICKGYYNLSATIEEDLVGYGGGDVMIKLEKSGTLPHGNITCTADADFAEVEYETNTYEATLTLSANDGAPRQVVVTFTDGYAETSVTVVQGADTAKGNTWELVTDASTLSPLDKVIVAAATYEVAMGTTISSGNNRPAVAVTKLGNYYLTPTVDVLTLVLANGSVEGTFAFYDAVNEGYLVSSSTSSSTYNLKNQAFINENTSYAISIADGVATIGNKEGTYSSCKFGYRAGTNKYFFSGTSTSQEKVCLYRLVGAKGEIPVSPADVTVPTKNVVVPEDGGEAQPITDVKFNYVGDWNITAVADRDWITFAFDKANNCLTYTALKNEDSAREATVTITASMEGEATKTWEFKVLQKGAPMEVSIAEFMTKQKDVNVAYKFTGVITAVSITESGYYIISDGNGNEAQVRYVRTDDGTVVATSDEIGLKVGDVVTVTTVVTTSVGKGGDSTNPTIYKGHYRLTATPSTTLASHEGGDVTFALATEGNLQPADGVINGTLVEGNDFVNFSHTTGATTATATFAANAGAPRNAVFNFTFGLASVSVTVGQQNDPAVKVGWYLVRDVSELAVGDKVIIASKNFAGDLNYAIKTYPYSSSKSYGIAIELLGDSINGVDGVEQFTLGRGYADYDDTWSFECDSHSRYLYVTSGDIKLQSTLNNAGSWTIDIAADGKATLISNVGTSASTKTHMGFNDAAASLAFSAYKAADVSSKGPIYIYKEYK